MVTSVAAAGLTTYAYESNGNRTTVQDSTGFNTMVYDKENRLQRHEQGGTTTTYTYSGDGLKRSENVAGTVTTLIWDGSDYLQGRA
jgi:YD repeat-containing protein